jgi:serine/threonine protein kinase
VILYELTTGQNLIKSKNFSAIFHEIIHGDPKIPEIKDRHATDAQREAVTRVISKSLLKAPEKRIQTGRQLAAALNVCLDRTAHNKITDKTTSSSSPKTVKPYFKIGLVMLLLMISVGTGWWMLGNMAKNHGTLFPNIFTSKQKTMSEPPFQANPADKHENSKNIIATLKIQSDPTGAKVLINGELKGRAPLSIELPLGEYHVTLRMTGHFDWETGVNLTGVMPEPISAKLEPLVF